MLQKEVARAGHDRQHADGPHPGEDVLLHVDRPPRQPA
jgi:hypothetical protein